MGWVGATIVGFFSLFSPFSFLSVLSREPQSIMCLFSPARSRSPSCLFCDRCRAGGDRDLDLDLDFERQWSPYPLVSRYHDLDAPLHPRYSPEVSLFICNLRPFDVAGRALCLYSARVIYCSGCGRIVLGILVRSCRHFFGDDVRFSSSSLSNILNTVIGVAPRVTEHLKMTGCAGRNFVNEED